MLAVAHGYAHTPRASKPTSFLDKSVLFQDSCVVWEVDEGLEELGVFVDKGLQSAKRHQ